MNDDDGADLDELMAAVWAVPQGEAQVAAAARAAARAEELDDPAALLRARLLLAHARYHVPTEPSHLALHAWLIAQLDTDVPDAGERRRILWIGKWAMSQMLALPEVPLAVVTDTFADLERRIRLEGFSDRAVAEHRIWLALAQGEPPDRIAAAVAHWQASERDSLSDCLACEANSWGRLLQLEGDLSGAVHQWQPVIDGDLGCTEEPHRVLALAADALARLGRVPEAIAAHQRGWRLARGNLNLSSAVAGQLMFLVRAGQPGRAVELLAGCHDWADRLPGPQEAMTFHAVTAAVLTAAHRAGVAPEEWDDTPLMDAVARHGRAAAEICARFVARNGSPHVAETLAARIDPTPYPSTIPLPGLGAAAEPTPTGVVAGVVAGAAAGALDAAGIRELAARVRQAVDLGDLARGALLTRWAAARRAAVDAGEPAAVLARAQLDRWLAVDRAGPDDPRWDEAVAAARATGEADQVALTECLRAVERALVGDEAARHDASGLAATLEIRGAGLLAAAAHRAVARIDGDDQDAHAARAVELYREAGDERAALTTEVERLRRGSGEAPVATRAAAAALAERARRAGHLRPELEALSLQAVLTAHAPDAPDGVGNLDAANELFDRIAARAAESAIATPLVARQDRATVATLADDPEVLAAAAAELVTGATTLGHPVALAQGRYRLGQAALASGDPLTAVQALEDAVATWRERDHDLLAPTLWLLGHALAELGDLDPAADTFREAARLAERDGNAEAAGEAWWQAGTHALRVDPTVAEDDLERSLAVAVATDDPDLELRARRAAASAAVARDPHAAVAHLDAVADQLPDWVGSELITPESAVDLRISLERQAAECLAQAGEWVAALTRIGAAEAMCGEDHPDELLAARSERAMYLADAGRVDEAHALLLPLLPDLEEVYLFPAVASLCRALAQVDREAEADELWATWIAEDEPR